MPLSSFFGGVQRFAGQALGRAQRAYGQVDKSVFGGALPGGADSPIVGSSVNREEQRRAVRNVYDKGADVITALQGYSAVRAIPEAGQFVYQQRVAAPSESISRGAVDKVRSFVEAAIPGDISIKYGNWPQGAHVFLNPEDKRVRLLPSASSSGLTHGPSAFHEFGHALSYHEPAGFQASVGRDTYRGRTGDVAAIASLRSPGDKDKPLLQAGLEGALTNLFTPGVRHTLIDEANASRRALELSRQFNLPAGRRGLAGAYSTYLGRPMTGGFVAGAAGELLGRATQKFGDFIGDQVIDPIADKLRGSQYSSLEEKLLPYGYNESQWRLKPLPSPTFGAPSVSIQRK
ncbi:hypothetical protein EBT25_06930 [bacterium]|nr:hypothetical protein [bacterium]